MRRIKTLACFVAVFAMGLVTAASALATPEFDATSYPAETKSESINPQGFNGGGVVIVCPVLTANTNEEIGNVPAAEAVNTTKNSPTQVTHPIYGGATPATKCKGTLVAGTFEVNVKTKFCNFRTHAETPGVKAGIVDVVCETISLPSSEVEEKSTLVNVSSTAKLQANFTVSGGKIAAGTTISKVNSATQIELSKPVEGIGTTKVKETLTFKSPGIENEFLGLPGCTITVFPQTLKSLEYKNEPKTGTAEQEVTIASEVAEIKSKATGACGIGEAEFKAEYREGKIKPGPPETAEIEPVGKPAKSVAKGFVPGTTTPIGGEVGINEAHWYENHVADAPQSGTGAELGESTISWGTLVLEKGNQSGTECRSEWGGHVYNTGAAGNFNGSVAVGAGNSPAGEVKVNAFQAYDCTLGVGSACTAGSALSVEPEGLGWGGKLSGEKTVKLGTAGTVKLHLKCTGYDATWTGELAPTLANGTEIGKAPSSLTFGGAANELTVAGTGVTETKGTINNKVKLMGYEGGELVTSKNP